MKILVTGSSGYVGRALLDRLAEDATCRVIGLDRQPADRPTGDAFGFVRCDLSRPGSALDDPLLHGLDAVVHLAAARGDWAIPASEYFRDNVEATRGLLSAPWAPSVGRWVFMSSVSTYGPSERALDETAACRPLGPYGESKLASERLFLDFVRSHRLRGCAIRPSAIFSAGHPDNTNVYRLIESLRRFPVPLIGGGRNRKMLTYLPNLLDLVQWCLERMRKGEIDEAVYNLVEEPVPSVAELIAALRDAGIRPARTVSIPLPLVRALAWPIFGLARLLNVDLRVTPERVDKYAASTWYDASKVKRDGFVPRVGLPQAIGETARRHLDRQGPR